MAAIRGLPTPLLLQSPRLAMADAQRRLSEAQAESATGRHADIGLALGAKIGSDIGLRLQLASVERTLDGIGQAVIRSDTVQAALSGVNNLAERFRSTLTGARTSESGRLLSSSFARTSIDSLHDTLGVSYDGMYLFGGLHTDTPPLRSYEDGPKQAIIDAFQTEFGFAPDNAAAQGLTPQQINSFLDGAFSSMFTSSGWTSTWSNAATEIPRFRLEGGQAVALSSTANAPFAQALTQAFAAIEVLGQSKISAVAFQEVTDRSLSLVSSAQISVGDEQARIGIGQGRLKDAEVELVQKRASTSAAIQTFEGVDPYDAATRVNLLMTQLESAYALTGRMSKMSLLTYI